jgi:glycerol kinase
MSEYIGAVDQGTTSTRFIIVDRQGTIRGMDQKEHRQIFPRPGWVEHDPLEIMENTRSVIRGALAKSGLTGRDLAAVGVTNQRETALVWDRRTGRPFHNAVVWQCARTDAICRDLIRDGGRDRFRKITGLPVATYFSGPKIRWILDRVPEAREAALKGDALYGTMDTWVIWNLTGGPGRGAHVTDVTNASRTLLMDLATLSWDPSILDTLDIPARGLPRIVPSSDPGIWGHTLEDGPLGAAVPVCGALGDQQAALFGQACFEPGEAKNTYGTGCFLLLNTTAFSPPWPFSSGAALLSTPWRDRWPTPAPWSSGSGTTWALSGSPGRSRIWPGRWRTTATSTAFPPSRGSSPPTGGPTPGGSSRA